MRRTGPVWPAAAAVAVAGSHSNSWLVRCELSMLSTGSVETNLNLRLANKVRHLSNMCDDGRKSFSAAPAASGRKAHFTRGEANFSPVAAFPSGGAQVAVGALARTGGRRRRRRRHANFSQKFKCPSDRAKVCSQDARSKTLTGAILRSHFSLRHFKRRSRTFR